MIYKKAFLLGYLCCILMALSSCNYQRSHADAFAPLPDSTNLAINQQIDFLTELIANDGSQADYYFQRARLYYQIDRLRTALADMNMALRLKGKNTQYLYWKALILKDLKDYPEAMEIAQEALGIGQADAPLYALIGELFYLTKNGNEALYYLELSTQLLPSYVDAIFYRGLIMYERKDSATAVKELTRAIEIDPKYVEAYKCLAQLTLQYKKYERSANYVGLAMKNGIVNEHLYFYLAQALHFQQQTDSAMHWYAETIKLQPNFWEASLELARYHASKRNYILSENYYRKTLEGNPNVLGVYFPLGYIYEYYLDRPSEALEAYQKGLAQEPNHTLLQHAAARVDRKINNPMPVARVKTDTIPRPRVRPPLEVSPLSIKRLP